MSSSPIDARLNKTLRINEIFFSIQGETTKAGLLTAFIRLTGCPLRCSYCDTEYAFYEGEKMSIADILLRIGDYRTQHVTVTGGEPLAQKTCIDLLTVLCDQGYEVSLETSGAIDVSAVDSRVMKILDLKTPASKEQHRNKMENLQYLSEQDQIKFVICNRADYEWSKQQLNEYKLYEKNEVLFSPSHSEVEAVELAEWVLKDKLPIRLQLQLHKYLWGDEPGH